VGFVSGVWGHKEISSASSPSFQLWMSSGGSALVSPSSMAVLALPAQLPCIPVGLSPVIQPFPPTLLPPALAKTRLSVEVFDYIYQHQ